MSAPAAALLLEALPHAVFVIDAQDALTYVNSSCEEWFGTSARFALGKPYTEFMDACARLAELLAKARAQAVSFSEYDFPVRLRHGPEQLSNMHIIPLDALAPSQGQVMLAFARRNYAAQQQEAQARRESVRSSGLLSAMLAHEVKNPLSGIRGAAQLLMEEVPEEQRPLAALICNEVDRIRDVLAQVETFAEGAFPALTPLNAHEVLRYVRDVAQAGAAHGIRLREEFDPSLPAVLAVRGPLVQLLLNLVKNAAEAVAGAREPCITLMTTSRQDFSVMGRRGLIRPQAHIIVQDNGPGIAPELLAHLFEPFISSHAEPGRGLGLAIAGKLAMDMGGVLAVEHTGAGGTRFRLTLKAG